MCIRDRGGVPYRTVVREGLILFKDNSGMSGSQIAMTRDPHARYSFLWYLEYDQCYQNIPMTHVDKAYRWVCAVYGGSHEIKKLPL